MDHTIPTSSSNASSTEQSAKNEKVDLLEEANQYCEILSDIVNKLEVKDSRPRSCSTPDTSKVVRVKTPTPTTSPIRKIFQNSKQPVTEILIRNDANNQRHITLSDDVIPNTNEEIAECINFVCVLIFGIMGFVVFIMLLEFVPNSNLTAALSVVGACLLLVLMFSFMSTLARKRTPLNRR